MGRGACAGVGAGAGAGASSGVVVTKGASSSSSGSSTSSEPEEDDFLDEEEKAEWREASMDGPPPAAPAEGREEGRVFEGGKELTKNLAYQTMTV